MVIIIETNAKNIAAFMRDLPRRMNRVTTAALRQTAREGVQIARSLAPSKSGALMSGITFIAAKRQAKILSAVFKPFPYQAWVNNEPGFQTIEGSKPYFMPGTSIRYGDAAAKSPSGNSIKWTGTPGYFNITFREINGTFVNSFVNNIKLELNRG